MDLHSRLARIEALTDLGPEALDLLAAAASLREFTAGTRIIRRGESGDAMFAVLDGRVEIPIVDDAGHRRFVEELGEGELFGEMALVTGEARSADVIALTDTTCLELPRREVEAAMRARPELARLLTTIVGRRLIASGGIRQVGKYRLAGELGRGRYSVVFHGIHPQLERSVAVKMLGHELVYQPHFSRRFRDEARILASLRHPGIVEVYDTEEAYATFFIVMEKLPGITLDRAIEARGPFSFDQTRDVLRQLAAALQCAHHHGVVHRDVKPSNVGLAPDGRVKLMDFGLALQPELASEDEPRGAGTPRYMAPEQIEGETIDGRADIYALGIVAYELLTGHQPFAGTLYQVLHRQLREPLPSPQSLRPDIPDDLVELVATATAKSPADRYQRCEEVLAALGEPEPIPLDRLEVETLGLVFEPAQRGAVERFLAECRQRAATMPGVKLR